MERFTVDAENKRRAIYNAGKDKDKLFNFKHKSCFGCLLYTSDAADE